MDYLWYMLGYSDSEGMPVNSGDSAKIRAVKRVMKKPVLIASEDEERTDDYSRPHPEFQMTFEAPDQDVLLEVIQGLRKVTINGHKVKGASRTANGHKAKAASRQKTPSPAVEEESEEESELLTSFVPGINHLAGAIVELKPTTQIVHGPYKYEENTVYHDICARRWEPEADSDSDSWSDSTEE